MKLHRFTAANNQKAILMIHEALGADALIYSTRRTAQGVEILAGLPNAEVIETDNVSWLTQPQHMNHLATDEEIEAPAEMNHLDLAGMQKITERLDVVDKTVCKLADHINNRFLEGFHVSDDDQAIKRNLLYYHLSKLGFRGKFCNQFVNNYFCSRQHSEDLNDENLASELVKYITVPTTEFIEEQTVCAIVGPTGVGKTTTIAKLAKRHAAKYGADSVGFITTDYHDIANRSQLSYYSQMLNIDLEYANNPKELSLAIMNMNKKKLILIDTHGVSQRDNKNVTRLLDLLESQGGKISVYMALPCNVQEPILDEIARAFNTTQLSGCILTKQDECISLAPALSVSINYKIKIAYICNGQDIVNDIESANPEKIIHKIVSESFLNKKIVEDVLEKNMRRVNDLNMELN